MLQPMRWLLFVHQLPSSPSNLRVRTWRRLQQIGAIAVKQAVYALPDTPAAREDFEWLKVEVESAGGQASVFSADAMDDALVGEFRRAADAAFAAVARDAGALLRRLGGKRRPASATRASRQPAGAPHLRRALQSLRERLEAAERLDFFDSAGRAEAVALVRRIEQQLTPAPAHGRPAAALNTADFQKRLWVTRPRPGVDRMASAWLIKRFIDPAARFSVASRPPASSTDAVPFDMFGVELTHRGGGCTFETLCEVFGLSEPALAYIAGIVHDLDLRDDRFQSADTPTIGKLIDGLRQSTTDDQQLLADGITLFEALYRASPASRLASAAPKRRLRGKARQKP